MSLLADLHFAATESARKNLLHEGIPANRILVTGNPVIDALQSMLRRPARLKRSRRWRTGTASSFWSRYEGQVLIVYPVHENPNVREPVRRILEGARGITLTSPLDYLSLVHLAKNSCMIVTDSGGLQEEGPSLGKPVLVMRNVTERPETRSSRDGPGHRRRN